MFEENAAGLHARGSKFWKSGVEQVDFFWFKHSRHGGVFMGGEKVILLSFCGWREKADRSVMV